jgi:hypothetical protein
MSRGLEPLASELRSLLADEQRFPPASARLRTGVMARARRSFLEPSAPAAPSFWRTRSLLLAAAVLVTAVGAAAVVGWYGSGSVPTPIPGVAAHVAATNGGSVLPAPASVPATPLVEPAQAEAVRPAEPGEPLPAPKRASAHDSTALELAILKRARTAVAGGNFSAALGAIGEHQRRFPDGNLREEREALRVKALSGLGKNDEARAAAERFRERFPDSVLAPRLEGSVRPSP